MCFPGASLTQLVKNPPAMQETSVWSLGWEDPLKNEQLPTPAFWPGEFHGLYSPWGRKESGTTEGLSLSGHLELWYAIHRFRGPLKVVSLVGKEEFHVCNNSFVNLKTKSIPFFHILLVGTQSQSYTKLQSRLRNGFYPVQNEKVRTFFEKAQKHAVKDTKIWSFYFSSVVSLFFIMFFQIWFPLTVVLRKEYKF